MLCGKVSLAIWNPFYSFKITYYKMFMAHKVITMRRGWKRCLGLLSCAFSPSFPCRTDSARLELCSEQPLCCALVHCRSRTTSQLLPTYSWEWEEGGFTDWEPCPVWMMPWTRSCIHYNHAFFRYSIENTKFIPPNLEKISIKILRFTCHLLIGYK